MGDPAQMARPPRKPRKGDHVVMGPGDNQVQCRHCGDVLTVPMPIDVRVFCDLMKSYGKVHRNCPKPQEANHAAH